MGRGWRGVAVGWGSGGPRVWDARRRVWGARIGVGSPASAGALTADGEDGLPWRDHPERLRDGPCDAAATSDHLRGAPGANARPMRRNRWDHVTSGFAVGSVAAPFRSRRCTSVTTVSGRSRSTTTTSGSRPAVTREQIAPGPRTIWRYARSAPGVGRPSPSTSARAAPRSCGPTAWRPSSDWASCGSRTTPPTRPARSRTGWCRWR